MAKKPMLCSECGREIVAKKTKEFAYAPKDTNLLASKNNVPFYCKTCGAVRSPLRAIGAVVFIYPFPPEPVFTAKKDSVIVIPESYKEYYPSDTGVVLSIGKGAFNTKLNKYVATTLKVGQVVRFDKTTLWDIHLKANNGKDYLVKRMSELDVLAECEV